jgi:hypothetical protein
MTTNWLDAVAAGETAETNALAAIASQVDQWGADLEAAIGVHQTTPTTGPVSLPTTTGPTGVTGSGAGIIALLSQTLAETAKIWTQVTGVPETQAIVTPSPSPATVSQILLVNDAQLQVLAGGSAEISSSLLSVSDSAYADAQLVYTVTAGPTDGTLLDGGVPVTRFTQADLDNGAVTYREDGATAPADTFAFTVADPARATVSGTFDISIGIPPPPVADNFYGDGTSALLLGYTNGDIADMPIRDGALAGGATYLASASDGWNYLTTADFNGDGSTDLLLVNGAGQIADYDIRNGAPSGAPIDTGTIGQGYTFLAAGAFSGPGSTGMLLTDAAGNIDDVDVKNGAFDGTVSYIGTVTGGWKFLAAGDFNGNGTTDILVSDPGGDINEWTIRNGMFAASNELCTLSDGWQFLGTGDFDGSGADQMLLGNVNGEIADASIKNGVLGALTYAGGAVDGWKFFGTGDFNGDGTTDIAVADAGGDIYEWMMKNGTISGMPEYLCTVDGGWHAIPQVA